LLDLIATMIVAGASSTFSTGVTPSNAMSLAALGSIIIGSAIFLLLIGQVAYASYKRRKEHDWHVAEWRRMESEVQMQQQEARPNKEMLH
jgi:hypothetical protein